MCLIEVICCSDDKSSFYDHSTLLVERSLLDFRQNSPMVEILPTPHPCLAVLINLSADSTSTLLVLSHLKFATGSQCEINIDFIFNSILSHSDFNMLIMLLPCGYFILFLIFELISDVELDIHTAMGKTQWVLPKGLPLVVEEMLTSSSCCVAAGSLAVAVRCVA